MNLEKAKARLKHARSIQKQIQELGLLIVETDPWVPVKIGGKEYKLEISFGAVQEVFRKTGVTIGLDQLTSADVASVDLWPVLLFEGLRTHHSDEFTSQDDLLRMIPVKHFAYYQAVLSLALQATQPDPEEVERLTDSLDRGVETTDPLADGSTSHDSGDVVSISDSPVMN